MTRVVKNITHLVERLDNKGERKVNCAGCGHKVGKVCDYHHAILQSNEHRPNSCEHWIQKIPKDSL